MRGMTELTAFLNREFARIGGEFDAINEALNRASVFVMTAHEEARALNRSRASALRAIRYRRMSNKRRPL